MKISRRKMLSQSLFIAIGSFFIPIRCTSDAVSGNKHLSKGLDLIHKVLSRPLDVGISHLDKCLVSNEVDIEKHNGFKDFINSLVNAWQVQVFVRFFASSGVLLFSLIMII